MEKFKDGKLVIDKISEHKNEYIKFYSKFVKSIKENFKMNNYINEMGNKIVIVIASILFIFELINYLFSFNFMSYKKGLNGFVLIEPVATCLFFL